MNDDATDHPGDWADTAITARRMGDYPAATLRQWRYTGGGPPYSRIGKRVVYHWPTVEKWMLAQSVRADH